jgi:lysophospholipase L1-like esterase
MGEKSPSGKQAGFLVWLADKNRIAFRDPGRKNIFMKHIFGSLFLTALLLLPGTCSRGAEAPHNFKVWEPEISAIERSDLTNPPPRHAIFFVGSSTIKFWTNLPQDFPGLPVINRGFGGSEICDSTHFADRIIFPYAPRQIVFRAGGNDLADGKSPEQVFADYQAFVALVEKVQPDTKITYISWNPTIARWSLRDKEAELNRMIKDFSSQNRHLEYVDTADMILGADGKPRADLLRADKLHLNPAGYKLLAERVRPYVQP